LNARTASFLGSALVLGGAVASGQSPLSDPVKLKAAIGLATASFGEALASRAELSASDETLSLAKKSYLPSADLYFQWNRASRNNVFGLLFPSAGLPSISGPVLEETSSQGTFGSVAAALVRWEAYDFGVRAAGIREAEALRRRAAAGARLTELEVSLGAMDAFLGVAAADSAVRAAEAAVARMEVFANTISALVANELRPGADLSLAQAELARTRSELIRAEELRERTRVSLAEWLGRAGERVEIEPTELLASPPAVEAAPLEEAEPHPLAELGEAERDAARARRDVAASAYRPKLDLLGAVYGRGTGALLDGSFEGGSEGLWPERTNWALGLAVRFPLLDLVTRQQTKVREYLEQAAEARYEYAVDRVASDLERARIHLDGARRIAENTPAELEAARALQVQARARYGAGLAEILEVAEAERILRRAETEDAIARLDVWRARFEMAAAEGNLASVLSELE
jgi:outer membrane protein TolC